MTIKEKKAKAAAIAVSCYLHLDNKDENEVNYSGWRRIGRALTLQRRDLLRISGRVPSTYRLRM